MKKNLRLFLKKISKINLTDLVSKDWLLKIISVVLAVILWSFVGGEDRVDKNVMIPIEIINLPRDLVISNQFKKEIQVSVSGPRSLILEMTSRAITRQVDLSLATPGTMVIENDNDHIPVPRGITVQRVQPSSIILSLDKLIQKKFPVTARTVGKVADGYYVKTLKMDPDIITITGPHTILSQFDELFTKAINLDGVKQSIQLQVPLELESAIVDLIGETSVTADISIGLETVTKTMNDMIVHVVIDGIKREVRPKKVRITASIPKKLLEANDDPKSLITVTAAKQEGDETLKINVVQNSEVELPIEILSIIPSEVSLVDANSQPARSSSTILQPAEEKISEGKPVKIEETAPPAIDADVEKNDGNEISPLKVIKSQKNKRKLTE